METSSSTNLGVHCTVDRVPIKSLQSQRRRVQEYDKVPWLRAVALLWWKRKTKVKVCNDSVGNLLGRI